MKVAENLAILFFLETKEASQDGLTPIYIRITVSGQRKEFSTGIKIDPANWDHATNRVIGKGSQILHINNQITQAKANLEKHYLLLTTQYEYVTADLLKKAYKGNLAEKNSDTTQQEKIKQRTLCQVFNYKYSVFARQVKKEIRSEGTLRKWRSTKTKIRKFCKHKFGKWDISLQEIKYMHADDLMNFLTLDENLKENTSRKYIKQIKELLEIAESRSWLEKNPWSKYRIGYDQPERTCLTMQEISRLNVHSLNQRLDYTRDVFLFACFTGYAFNELRHFTRKDVFLGDDGKRWIKIDRMKTGKPESIPLLPIPGTIVDKYWNDPWCVAHSRLLPVKSNVHYNGYLKEIASIIDINLELTSHIARHTFATTVCLENDVPIEVVQKLLGHSNIRTTQIYAQVTKKKISNNLQDLEKKLFSSTGELKKPLGEIHSIGIKEETKIAI
jgi:integrase